MQRVFYPQGTKLGQEIFSRIHNTEAMPYLPAELQSLEKESADFLIANTRLPINIQTFHRFPGIKGFGTVSSGIDHVNFNDIKKYNKTFVNAPGCNAGSVAEYVWFGYFKLLEENPLFFSRDSKPEWGIIGMGNVGKKLTIILDHFSIPYSYYDPFVEGGCDWEEIFSKEVVTIHVPLTKDGNYPTYKFISPKYGKILSKKKSIFINTSRGEVVDPSCMDILLENRNILGIVDVFFPEPPQSDAKKYLKRKDWIYTPHIAGYSQIGRLSGTWIVANKIAEHFGESYPYPLEDFLQENLDWKSSEFIREESNLLRESWKMENWEYFEKRRNNYPLRLDDWFFR